jgi:hypothetical protein
MTQQGAPAHVTRKSAANAAVIPRCCSGLVDNPLYSIRYLCKNIKKGIISLQTDQSNVQQ